MRFNPLSNNLEGTIISLWVPASLKWNNFPQESYLQTSSMTSKNEYPKEFIQNTIVRISIQGYYFHTTSWYRSKIYLMLLERVSWLLGQVNILNRRHQSFPVNLKNCQTNFFTKGRIMRATWILVNLKSPYVRPWTYI